METKGKFVFRNPFKRDPSLFMNSQPEEYPKTQPVFQKEIDKYGRVSAKVVGETNVYLQKQEQKNESLLYTQLDKYVRGQGDLNFVKETEARICDLVGAPTSLMEAQNSILRAKDAFMQLPLETRQKHGNDFSVWLRTLDLNAQRNKTINKTADGSVPPAVEVKPVGGNSDENAAT